MHLLRVHRDTHHIRRVHLRLFGPALATRTHTGYMSRTFTTVDAYILQVDAFACIYDEHAVTLLDGVSTHAGIRYEGCPDNPAHRHAQGHDQEQDQDQDKDQGQSSVQWHPPPPQLVVAFNAGIAAYSTWLPTLLHLQVTRWLTNSNPLAVQAFDLIGEKECSK